MQNILPHINSTLLVECFGPASTNCCQLRSDCKIESLFRKVWAFHLLILIMQLSAKILLSMHLQSCQSFSQSFQFAHHLSLHHETAPYFFHKSASSES